MGRLLQLGSLHFQTEGSQPPGRETSLTRHTALSFRILQTNPGRETHPDVHTASPLAPEMHMCKHSATLITQTHTDLHACTWQHALYTQKLISPLRETHLSAPMCTKTQTGSHASCTHTAAHSGRHARTHTKSHTHTDGSQPTLKYELCLARSVVTALLSSAGWLVPNKCK